MNWIRPGVDEGGRRRKKEREDEMLLERNFDKWLPVPVPMQNMEQEEQVELLYTWNCGVQGQWGERRKMKLF